MNTYLAIITTVLVITQIIRLIQNAIDLKRRNNIVEKQLKGIEDITNEDIYNQRKMHKLAIEYFEQVLERQDGE